MGREQSDIAAGLDGCVVVNKLQTGNVEHLPPANGLFCSFECLAACAKQLPAMIDDIAVWSG